MKSAVKLILLIVLLNSSENIFGQSETKEVEVKAYKEAKAREEAQKRAEAEAKEREKQRKLFESQAKSESNQAKMSAAATANVNAKAAAFYSVAMSQINTKHRTWIKQNAKKIFVEKMDDLSFKIMARYYGQNAGLNEQDIEGLQVLLLRETYLIANKELNNYENKSTDINEKKLSLLNVQQLLLDSSHQLSQEELDSINLLISNSVVTEKDNTSTQPLDKVEKTETPDRSARKMPDNTTSFSNLALTKTKLAENLVGLGYLKEEQEVRMLEISQRQQKITLLLSRMVNQVTEHQEKIIQNLK